jgi:site-specific DNA-methyltransferase (adenine-specific)
VLAYGVGGLNIDASRVESGTDYHDLNVKQGGTKINGGNYNSGVGDVRSTVFKPAAGRFPANVLLDEHAAAEMDKQSGVTSTRPGAGGDHKTKRNSMGGGAMFSAPSSHDDTGGASRFFPVFKYQAKAPKKERPVIEREDGSKIQHPTVKPLTLLEWLVTLITPPGGVILDPFAGSGTTLEAARNKGFNAIGIEREADYVALINKRLGSQSG